MIIKVIPLGRSSLATMMNDAQRLSRVVRSTAHLAESVSSKVKLLDLAKVHKGLHVMIF